MLPVNENEWRFNKREFLLTSCVALFFLMLAGVALFCLQGTFYTNKLHAEAVSPKTIGIGINQHERRNAKPVFLAKKQTNAGKTDFKVLLGSPIDIMPDAINEANIDFYGNADAGAAVKLLPGKSPLSAEIFTNGPRDSKRVALTFDLCEAENDRAGFDDKIVGILFKKRAKATFFMGGKWAESHPDDARLLSVDSLFEIENHSYSHKIFTKISDEEAKQQIVQAQESIRKLTGVTPKYFRFPADLYADKHLKIVKDLGLKAVLCDVITGDPDPNISATDIIDVVKEKATGGSIIIMHANGRGWHTAEALPAVIDYLRSQGYELVTVGELLGEK